MAMCKRAQSHVVYRIERFRLCGAHRVRKHLVLGDLRLFFGVGERPERGWLCVACSDREGIRSASCQRLPGGMGGARLRRGILR